MCNALILLVIVLVAYLFFKNISILIVGGIVVLLSYFFNYKEGAINKQLNKTRINAAAKLKGVVVKKPAPKKENNLTCNIITLFFKNIKLL
jgi:hypothetical protein